MPKKKKKRVKIMIITILIVKLMKITILIVRLMKITIIVRQEFLLGEG